DEGLTHNLAIRPRRPTTGHVVSAAPLILPGDGPTQRLARRRRPGLRLLVTLGVTVEGALEIAQGDHEAGPAVPEPDLEHVMLDECPGRVRERCSHRDTLSRQHARADRRIAVRLVQNLLEISEGKLPHRALELSDRPIGLHLDPFVDDAGVAHRPLAIELRLAIVRIPAGSLDPAPHEI